MISTSTFSNFTNYPFFFFQTDSNTSCKYALQEKQSALTYVPMLPNVHTNVRKASYKPPLNADLSMNYFQCSIVRTNQFKAISWS